MLRAEKINKKIKRRLMIHTLRAEIKRLKEENERLRAENDELREQRDDFRTWYFQAKEENHALRQQAADMRYRLGKALEVYEAQQKEIERLTGR